MRFGMHKTHSVSVHACITKWPAGCPFGRGAPLCARLIGSVSRHLEQMPGAPVRLMKGLSVYSTQMTKL